MNTINLDSNIANYSSVVVGSAFDIRLTDRLPVPGFVDFPASPEAPKIPPLGNNVKLQAVSPENSQTLMIERYRLLALSKRILADVVKARHSNVLGCQRVAVYRASTIGLTQSTDSSIKGFNFRSVATCRSAWICPVCARVIAAHRANEVRQAIVQTKKSNGDVYMLTLTFRHSRFDDLADLLGKCKKALVKMWGQWAVKDLMKRRFVGRIAATELTYSDASGWHPHQHILLFGVKGLTCESLQAVFGEYWIRALNSCGLSGLSDVACNVQPASAVRDYLTKMSSEIALGNAGTKQGRNGHYSPFELLGMCRVRDDYKRLWREFYTVTRGKRSLVWSDRLKHICGIGERLDGDLVEELEKFKPVFFVDTQDFKELLTDYDLGFIRGASSDEVVLLLDRRGVRYTMATEERR